MDRKLAVAAAFVATLVVAIIAALGVTTGASAATKHDRTGPLTINVICVELLTDAPKVKNRMWRVHFGASTTRPVAPGEIRKSEFEDSPGWHVVAGSEPQDFESTGFANTGGAAATAIVAENELGFGDESITWDVDLVGPRVNSPHKAEFDGDRMGASSCPSGTVAIEAAAEPQGPVRAIFCSAPGNTLNGTPVAAGTALNLIIWQPIDDPNFKGATPAIFVQGVGATCDPPPPGYSFDGKTFVDGSGTAHGLENAIYRFYTKV